MHVRVWVRSLVVLLGLALAVPAQAGGQGQRQRARPARGGAAQPLQLQWAQRNKPQRQTRKARKAQAQAQLADLHETIYQSRDIASHEMFLGKGFFRSLRGLRKGDHWIEIGPSSEPVMALGYLFDTPEAVPYRFPREKADVTGIGLEELDPELARQLDKAMPARGVRYEHRSGRLLEQYKRRSIRKAKVVSDQFGAFAYTARPQRILEIEGSLLVRGGLLHTHSSPWTKVVDKDGNDVFVEWLKATKGVELVEHERVERYPMSWHKVALRRTEGTVRAPPLRVRKFEAGHPPIREFVWDGRPARPERTKSARRSSSRSASREAPSPVAAP